MLAEEMLYFYLVILVLSVGVEILGVWLLWHHRFLSGGFLLLSSFVGVLTSLGGLAFDGPLALWVFLRCELLSVCAV